MTYQRRWRRPGAAWIFAAMVCATTVAAAAELPFQHKVETYRAEKGDAKGDVLVFALRLEQPFLAEEFEKSNYLRLRPTDDKAYLIYPQETRFQQKHAEFYGRLRGEGKAGEKAVVKLSYELVSENLDGTRKVEVRAGEIEVPIPTAAGGPSGIYREWAQQQNQHFVELLRYYPHESFYQYCLLQSRARYGVTPPAMPRPLATAGDEKPSLYDVFTGSLAVQEALQRQVLSGSSRPGDLDIHISEVRAPELSLLPYETLLEERTKKHKVQPKLHDIARLVPHDQYFLHFRSMSALNEALDLTSTWGGDLLRLLNVRAQDHQLRAKLEDQLCVRRDVLTQLFADAVVSEVAVTGADPFVLEGTDVTMIFHLKKPAVFQAAATRWLDDVRKKYPSLVQREFNFRGHQITAHYTTDRVVSSFVAQHGEYVVYSNSHRAIRKVIDAALGMAPSVHAALDYRYITTILPPADAENTGYLFASGEFLKNLLSPAAKISEKRRLQCFNNLVMLNNASLMYRLEHARSPQTLSDLVEGQFVDLDKVVCPHGGAYAFDSQRDTCTCSMHNRLKYLTPNTELEVLKVSRGEMDEYNAFRQAYESFWRDVFDPIAVRITMDQRVKLETCVLPFARGSYYTDLRASLAKEPQPLGLAGVAPSAVFSVMAVPGRKTLGDYLRAVPGVEEVLKADPTLTDLGWLGERASIHLCDDDLVLEIDPMRLRPLDTPLARLSQFQQVALAMGVMAVKLPVYATIDVEDNNKAQRLLEQLSRKIFLKGDSVLGISSELDAYRLPDYKQHQLYVLSVQLYAVKLRLYVSLLKGQLVAATKPEIVREVIDAHLAKEAAPPQQAHMLLRLNRSALNRLHDNAQTYWTEKARLACHRNTISIYNLCKLYGVSAQEASRIAEAKYGVRYFCPDHGEYHFDAASDEVQCSVHGNRRAARQNPRLDRKSSFAQFIDSLEEVVATLRFQDEALIATVEIARRARGK